MHCDQSWCHNLVSDLKVKLKVKLVVGGCLGALEQDTPPLRSVLGVSTSQVCAWDNSKRPWFFFWHCQEDLLLLSIIYDSQRERWGERQREESLLFTEKFFHSLKRSSILHIPGWERQLRYLSLRKNRIFGAVSKLGGREACSKSHKGPRTEKLIAQSESLANRGETKKEGSSGPWPLAAHK